KSTIEEKGDKKFIIIEEIPYLVNKSVLLENIAKCISNKKIDGVNDLIDESDRKGMRVVIELKRGYDSNLVLNQLCQNTSLETTFGVIMIALVNGEPKVLNLKDLMLNYILHRKDVVTKRTKFDLNKSEERKHLVDGLIIALDDIDNVVRLIKESKDVEVANKLLIEKYSLSNSQSKAILDMKLQRLTSLETEKLKEENIELISRIKDLKEILGSEEKVFTIVRNELKEIKTSFSDERRTLVEENGKIIEEKELVKEEATVITLTHKGYIKRIKLDAYKEQRRGGKGVIGAVRKEEDFIEHLKIVSTHDNILFFGDKGRVYWKKAYEIMEGSRYSIGSNIVNFLNLKDERITAIIPIREFKEGYFLFMGTKKGLVKKVELNEFAKERRNGKIAINLKNDELIDVLLTDGNKEIIIGTSNGIASRFR
ncbi:MAG TPA: DNA gyrase subunit A, partial [Candidatus Nanoarchaeia archaeon]|nr:DNA gyrase subunit A [Candidatus Nanoarchaeia archaeon]